MPGNLIQRRGEQSFVWIADRSEGIAVLQPIECGQESADGLVEVHRGLNASSRLIVSGVEGLAESDPIRVSGEDTRVGTATLPPES